MKLLEDYDYTILYYPRKVNMVVNALSQKFIGSLSYIVEVRRLLIMGSINCNQIKRDLKSRNSICF